MRRKVKGVIWNMISNEEGTALMLEIRAKDPFKVDYVKLDLKTNSISEFASENEIEWSSMQAFNKDLFVAAYTDRADPNIKKYFKYQNGNRLEIELKELLPGKEPIIMPHIYEQGTPYFNTVQTFIGSELGSSCEYLEISNKIIISYYIRSGKELLRSLQLLEDGEKVMEVDQDKEMMGFAPGSFFALHNKLIFVVNRNEICIYPL